MKDDLYCYVDESGTNLNEGNFVLAATIIEADRVGELLAYHSHVLSKHRKFFPESDAVFHMADVYNRKGRFQSATSAETEQIIADFLRVRVALDTPTIIVQHDLEKTLEPGRAGKHSPEHYRMMGAYAGCFSLLLDMLNQLAGAENRMARVFVEGRGKDFDNGLHRLFTRKVCGCLFDELSSDDALIFADRQPLTNLSNELRVVGKDNPAVQFSDAIAFAARRYFAGLPYGERLLKMMMADGENVMPIRKLQNGPTILLIPRPSESSGELATNIRIPTDTRDPILGLLRFH